MIILFLVFILQFTLACVCLTMNEDQVYGLVEESWINSGMDTKAMVQHQLDCCGLKRDPADEYPSCSQVCNHNLYIMFSMSKCVINIVFVFCMTRMLDCGQLS